MSNIQIHLVFKKPEFFTSEPILQQLKDFADLGFSPKLKHFFKKNKMQPVVMGYAGAGYLDLLEQLITELDSLQTIEKIDTLKARQQYALFVHSLRHREGYEEQIKNQLGKEFQSLKEDALNQDSLLLQNVPTRARLFKEKIIALRDQQLLAQATHYAQIAGQVYQTALQIFIKIDNAAENALQKSDRAEVGKSIDSIKNELQQIEDKLKAFDRLDLQHALDRCQNAQEKKSIGEMAQMIEESKEKVLAPHKLAQERLLKLIRHNESLQNQEKEETKEQPVTAPVMIADLSPPLLTDKKEDTEVSEETSVDNSTPPENNAAPNPDPQPNPEDETRLKQQETLRRQLDTLITLVKNYQALLKSEKSNCVIRFFHQSRKDIKMSYCEALLTSLAKAELTPDRSLKDIVTEAHEHAKNKVNSSPLLTAGGSYMGTSRMLAVQRLLGIDEAWNHNGKSSFMGAPINSDFHGLKTTGVVGKVKQTVVDFFEGHEDTAQFEALCEKVAPTAQALSPNKTAVH